jgi:hypothetical protein
LQRCNVPGDIVSERIGDSIQEVTLAAEIVLEGPFRNISCIGNLARRGTLIAFAAEHLCRRSKYFGSARGHAPLAAGVYGLSCQFRELLIQLSNPSINEQ